MSYTPMIAQYLEIKKQYPDAVLFFRLGDFYEMFFEDAVLASRELEITLTGRDGGEERVPMCGVPYHAAESYIAKLVGKGYRVAICEQVEDPACAKGVVRREVTRVVTPGTVMEGSLLEEKSNNYLACVSFGAGGYGMAICDLTTGYFAVADFLGERAKENLLAEVSRLAPAELLLPLSKADELSGFFIRAGAGNVSGYRDEAFFHESSLKTIEEQFGLQGKEIYQRAPFAVPAAAALLTFLRETQKRELLHINKINFYFPGKCMVLDASTRRNLELTRSISSGSKQSTLLSVLDYTKTSMGGRMLKNWIEQPLLEEEEINTRLDAVEELAGNIVLRGEFFNALQEVYDLERLAGRISYGTANARDLVALRASLAMLPAIKDLLEKTKAPLLRKVSRRIDLFLKERELLEKAIVDNPPISLREGGIIREGYSAEVDRLRKAGREGKFLLSSLEERERARTGIKSLKVGFNKVFGYYIEVTKPNLSLIPPDYQRKQTLVNAERFVTPELKEYEEMVLGAQEKLCQLEYSLFIEIREALKMKIASLQKTATALAVVDVLCSLAEAAVRGNYVRPVIKNDGIIYIKDGRHPVLEAVMGPGKFVPNDTFLDNGQNRLILLTGPNMAGKSTYMRQVALIVLMAQIGSFVPAERAEISLVDRIFTRIGAFDDLAGGLSTFMVEMNECRTIVSSATDKSLIIMDEVGRGTSTYDGISIARALVEYIHLKIKAKTLFSTHYHELTSLEEIEGIVNFNVAVKEEGEEVIFLRKVVPGKTDRSYGIHVAKLAGLPREIIDRSYEILRFLENGSSACGECKNLAPAGQLQKSTNTNNNYLNGNCYEVLRELSVLDILGMTPLEAINKLYFLQKKLLHSS